MTKSALKAAWMLSLIALISSARTLAQPEPTPEPPEPETRAAATARARETRLGDALKGYTTFANEPAGVAQSANLGVEALQIAGQIVADRASGAALELVRSRLTNGLCEGAMRGKFESACAVIRSIRLQDLAGSGRALLEALASDGLALIARRLPASMKAPAEGAAGRRRGAGEPDVAQRNTRTGPVRRSLPASPSARCEPSTPPPDAASSTLALLGSAVMPEIMRAAEGRASSASTDLVARQLLETQLRMLEQAVRCDGGSARNLTRGQRAVLLAGIAVGECMAAKLHDCEVSGSLARAAETFAIDDLEIAYTAERLAIHTLETMMLDDVGEIDWRGRMLRTLDAAFETTCLISADGDRLDTCPAAIPSATPAHRAQWLSAARALLGGLIESDVNKVLSVLTGVAAHDDAAGRRALRIAATVLRYARTYTEKGDANAAHAERVELLEDLTADMTDRIDREGDWVVSLGGALQGAFGVRRPFDGDESSALFGPVALPLGIGLQTVGNGLHLHLGVVDLGQYLSWKAGPKVAKANVADALAPTLTVGYAWGTSFPAFAGVLAGYAPNFRPSDTANRGSIQVGATVGVYVPLLDLN